VAQKLVTVAVFGTPAEAMIAKNRLEVDGIRALVADETIVGMAWHLGSAVGGIKLQVAQHDAELALSILEGNEAVAISEAEWASHGADHEQSEDEWRSRWEEDAEESRAEIAVSPAEQIVVRAFRAAVLGFFFLPLQLYSLWLVAGLWFTGENLSPSVRWRLAATAVLNLPVVAVIAVIVAAYLSG
jgi:hypothetical protein